MKVAGLCGIVNPIMVFILITLAILNYPNFDWKRNALSDLGVDGLSAILFNSALIAGGLITTLFAIGLRRTLPTKPSGRIGAYFLTADAISLSLIGIFPETAGVIHFYASLTFFVLLPISLLLIGMPLVREPSSRDIGLLTVSAGVVGGLVWLPQWRGVAIPEAISSLAASACSMAAGFRLIRRAMDNTNEETRHITTRATSDLDRVDWTLELFNTVILFHVEIVP